MTLVEDRLLILESMLTEFPELRSRALHLILEMRPPLGPEERRAVTEAFRPVHDALSHALARLGEVGITAKVQFNSEKGYLIVLLRPASEEQEVKVP